MSEVKKFRIAAISLYNKLKLFFIHAQMSSI